MDLDSSPGGQTEVHLGNVMGEFTLTFFQFRNGKVLNFPGIFGRFLFH